MRLVCRAAARLSTRSPNVHGSPEIRLTRVSPGSKGDLGLLSNLLQCPDSRQIVAQFTSPKLDVCGPEAEHSSDCLAPIDQAVRHQRKHQGAWTSYL